MARPPKKESEKRVRVATRLHPELYAWLSKQIDAGTFKDWAHGFDRAVEALRAEVEGK